METIFAEKLETVISKGATNSRMKDYHDLLLICRENGLLKYPKLKEDIKNTFKNRNTRIKDTIKFLSDEYLLLQQLWSSHRRGIGEMANELNLPENIEDLVIEVNNWIVKNKLIS